MKIVIDEILYYGRDYLSPLSCNPIWWYGKADGKVYAAKHLMEEFAYASCEAIIEAGFFIPLFRTNIPALERAYLEKYLLLSMSERKRLDASDDFDRDFHKFIEKNGKMRGWHTFERQQLRQDAIS